LTSDAVTTNDLLYFSFRIRCCRTNEGLPMTSLLHPGIEPFIVAIAMMAFLLVLELVALLIGLGLTEHAGGLLASHAGLDHPAEGADLGAVAQCLSWLHVGRIPFLVIVTLLLLGFSIAGLTLQYAAQTCLGVMLSAPAASAVAIPVALVFTRCMGSIVARLMPSIQTSALSESEFIGLTGQIVGAEAKHGIAGQARIIDRFGQAHYIRVEPMNADEALAGGVRMVIVERVSDSLYRAARF
jgi:hypothetical protein